MSGVTFNVANGVSSPDDVAVNPYFRKALVSVSVGTAINYKDWNATLIGQNQITDLLLPKLASLTPNGAAYLNEADFQASDFQTLFYGAHYDSLNEMKSQYDPRDIFYPKTAIGSDRWAENAEGRLCKV